MILRPRKTAPRTAYFETKKNIIAIPAQISDTPRQSRKEGMLSAASITNDPAKSPSELAASDTNTAHVNSGGHCLGNMLAIGIGRDLRYVHGHTSFVFFVHAITENSNIQWIF